MSDAIDNNPDIAVGVNLPLSNSGNGFFSQSFTTLEAAKSNIKNLLLTMKGERPMQPEFGCDLFTQLFEPMVEGGEIEERCKNAIEEAIEMWLPYINIDDLTFTNEVDDINNNRFRISLVFSIKSDPTRFEELTFTVAGATGV